MSLSSFLFEHHSVYLRCLQGFSPDPTVSFCRSQLTNYAISAQKMLVWSGTITVSEGPISTLPRSWATLFCKISLPVKLPLLAALRQVSGQAPVSYRGKAWVSAAPCIPLNTTLPCTRALVILRSLGRGMFLDPGRVIGEHVPWVSDWLSLIRLPLFLSDVLWAILLCHHRRMTGPICDFKTLSFFKYADPRVIQIIRLPYTLLIISRRFSH